MPYVTGSKRAKNEVHRGEIYIAELGVGCGSEQIGCRPVLVVQNERGNHYSPTVIVAPLTSRIYTKSNLPTHCVLPADVGLLRKSSTVMLEQIRTIDKTRLKQYVGRLTADQMTVIDKALLTSLGLSDFLREEKALGATSKTRYVIKRGT